MRLNFIPRPRLQPISTPDPSVPALPCTAEGTKPKLWNILITPCGISWPLRPPLRAGPTPGLPRPTVTPVPTSSPRNAPPQHRSRRGGAQRLSPAWRSEVLPRSVTGVLFSSLVLLPAVDGAALLRFPRAVSPRLPPAPLPADRCGLPGAGEAPAPPSRTVRRAALSPARAHRSRGSAEPFARPPPRPRGAAPTGCGSRRRLRHLPAAGRGGAGPRPPARCGPRPAGACFPAGPQQAGPEPASLPGCSREGAEEEPRGHLRVTSPVTSVQSPPPGEYHPAGGHGVRHGRRRQPPGRRPPGAAPPAGGRGQERGLCSSLRPWAAPCSVRRPALQSVLLYSGLSSRSTESCVGSWLPAHTDLQHALL